MASANDGVVLDWIGIALIYFKRFLQERKETAEAEKIA